MSCHFVLETLGHGWGCCSSATLSTSSRADSETDPIDPRRSLENAVEALLSTSGHKQDQKPETVPAQPSSRRYTIPVTDTDVAKARVESVPKKTREDSSYCVKDWASNRQQNVEIPPLAELDKQGLQYWLSRFLMEIRTKKGAKYAPNSLHHIVSGIMRHLRQNCGRPDIDFFKDHEFANEATSICWCWLCT